MQCIGERLKIIGVNIYLDYLTYRQSDLMNSKLPVNKSASKTFGEGNGNAFISKSFKLQDLIGNRDVNFRKKII